MSTVRVAVFTAVLVDASIPPPVLAVPTAENTWVTSGMLRIRRLDPRAALAVSSRVLPGASSREILVWPLSEAGMNPVEIMGIKAKEAARNIRAATVVFFRLVRQ